MASGQWSVAGDQLLQTALHEGEKPKLKSYRDLEVWKKSIKLAKAVYQLSARFPPEEKFGLTSQVRRAVISVAANIAEGSERQGNKEFLHFLSIAGGSLAETETFLVLAQELGMAGAEHTNPLLAQSAEVGRMLNGLKRSLRAIR